MLAGIGVTPATDFLEGVQRHHDGGLLADQFLEVADGLYAAGDVAHVPDQVGQLVRVEQWRVACQQGRIAGKNMAGQRIPYRSVPFFWSAQYELTLRYLGQTKEFDEIHYDGQVEAQEFIAYYAAQGKVKAVLGLKRDADLAVFYHLMQQDQILLTKCHYATISYHYTRATELATVPATIP